MRGCHDDAHHQGAAGSDVMAKRTRQIEGAQRSYQWWLFPTPEQADALAAQARMCAGLWNALLEMCETIHCRSVQHQRFERWRVRYSREHCGG